MQRLRLIPSRHNKASGRGCRFCRSLQDDNLVIYNGWGTADCDRIPLDTQLNLTFAGLLNSFWVKKDSLLGAAISFSGVLCLVFVSRSPGLGAQTKHRLSVCFRINSLSVFLMDQPLGEFAVPRIGTTPDAPAAAGTASWSTAVRPREASCVQFVYLR